MSIFGEKKEEAGGDAMPLYMYSMHFSIVQFHKHPFMNYLFYDNPRGYKYHLCFYI